MRWLKSDLFRQHDFVRFWQAQAVSQVGTTISMLALPLTAALVLDAGPFEVGLLAAISQLPALIFGLLAGAVIDRHARRPVMIAADLGRAALFGLIPIAHFFDLLSMPLLYVVGFLAGTFTILFDIAYLSFVPSLVSKKQLVDANSKLEATFSIATVIGPGLGGALVAVLTAPFAILVDAISFLVSAALLRDMHTPEEPPKAVEHVSIKTSITQGLRTVRNDPVLRAMLGCSSINNLFGNMFLAVYTLFMLESLNLSSTAIGFVFAVGGVAALLGALVAEPIAIRIGNGWAQIFGQGLFALTGLLIPLAVLFKEIAFPLVVAAEFLQWLFLMIYIINAMSLRQSRVESSLMGRVNSTFVFVVGGSRPIGAFLGGVLGALIGLPLTLVVGELGIFLAVAWLYFSPVRQIRSLHGMHIEPSTVQRLAEATAIDAEPPAFATAP